MHLVSPEPTGVPVTVESAARSVPFSQGVTKANPLLLLHVCLGLSSETRPTPVASSGQIKASDSVTHSDEDWTTGRSLFV